MTQKIVEVDLLQVLQEFAAFVGTVTGSESGRPRFGNFKIQPEVKAIIAIAVEEAKTRIYGSERRYAINALKSVFERDLTTLDGKLDDELWKPLVMKYRDYFELVQRMATKDVDMNYLSKLYWDLRTSLDEAPKEQAIRKRKGEERIAAHKEREKKAKEAKEAQLASKKEEHQSQPRARPMAGRTLASQLQGL